MAQVYRCDRCRTIFDDDVLAGIVVPEQGEPPSLLPQITVACCPDCRVKLRDFLAPLKVAVVLLALVCGLAMSACATFPPKNPDGSIDVAKLVDYAEGGIEADCALGFNQDICTFGRDTIANARAAMAHDPQAQVAAVRQSLADSVARWPVIAPYVKFVQDVLR